MDEPTLVSFLWRLTTATESAKVEWKPLSEDTRFRFGARVGRFVYFLISRDNDDAPPFIFTIHRMGATSESSEIASWNSQDHSTLTDPLGALYTEVKRRTLGYHTLLSEIFEDLAAADGGSPLPDLGSSSGAQPF